MQTVQKYLLENGFKKLNDENVYMNDKCTVRIMKNIYEIELFGHGGENNVHSLFSSSLDIYWLIGVLNYHKLI